MHPLDPAATEHEASASSDDQNQGADSDDGRKPVVTQQLYTTGDKWTDLKVAARRISIWNDLKHIGEIPCARSSLLMGIGAGTGIGFVRGMNTKPFVAANWAMGTFVVVSVGAWNVCQAGIRREREQVRAVVEQMAERKKLRRAGQEQNGQDGRGEGKP